MHKGKRSCKEVRQVKLKTYDLGSCNYRIRHSFVLHELSKQNQRENLSGQSPEDEHWKSLESIVMSDASNTPLFNKLIALFKSGEGFYSNEIFSKEEINALSDNLERLENMHDKSILSAIYQDILLSRDSLFYSAGSSGLQLQPGEECLFKTKNSILNTVQSVYKKLNYYGFRANMGMYRSGTIYYKPEDVEGFRAFGSGTTYITNKRVVFITNSNQNKSYNLKSILSFAPYEGNSVLLNLANEKPVVINFNLNGMLYFSDPNNVEIFNDDKMNFLYALDKALE